MPSQSVEMGGREKPQALKVFIAEDEPLLQMSLEDILNDMGHDVVACVASVKDALAAIANQKFDLAILDVHLADGAVDPVMDRLAQIGIPIVLATGALLDEAYPAPVVSKPYDAAQIGSAIASVAPPKG